MTTVWTLPNILTYFRLVAAFLIPVIFLVIPFDVATPIALVLYILAAVTDFFDGWLARKLDQVTALGRMLDPIADKIMVVLVLLTLASLQQLHTWVFIVPAVAILGREIIISGLREFLAGSVQIPVTRAAKWKTTVQLFALGFLLCALFETTLYGTLSWTLISTTGFILLWLAAILTVMTGYSYFKAALPALLK